MSSEMKCINFYYISVEPSQDIHGKPSCRALEKCEQYQRKRANSKKKLPACAFRSKSLEIHLRGACFLNQSSANLARWD